MKTITIILTSIWITASTFASQVTLSGYLKDKSNGEALIGATVYIEELQKGVVSNPYGFYSISLPEGHYNVTYSYIGFKA